MSQYITNFEDNASVIDAYRAPADALDGATVYLAWYGYGDYSGHSLVVFEKDGTLYEVNGSHCSCSGLEEQWDPEETSWEALDGRYFYGDYEGSQEADRALHEPVSAHLAKS